MSKLLIDGSRRLEGEVLVHGAKNSILPILAATIICAGDCVLHNCPQLTDVEVAIKILKYLGCDVKREGSTLIINSDSINRYDIPDSLMREMRSSIVFLGAIISRFGKANMTFPGGCELGPRPIDLHLESLKKMGVTVKESHGYINCGLKKKLAGVSFTLSFPSVGATENIMLAACLADGETVINNAAREPEICDLANFLNNCGAKIEGSGEGTIKITGVGKLIACEHSIIPDRIVAATFMSAIAGTGGEALVKNIVTEHLRAIIPIFEEAGCSLKTDDRNIAVKAPDRLNSIKTIRTMPYPGFPTDAQAPLMSILTVANGISVFTENIFDSRYKHVGELQRLGANIKVEGKVAVVEGVKKLSGAVVESRDLRGSAALVIAGLMAEGRTEVRNLEYIDRGYDKIEESLKFMGANIKRI